LQCTVISVQNIGGEQFTVFAVNKNIIRDNEMNCVDSESVFLDSVVPGWVEG